MTISTHDPRQQHLVDPDASAPSPVDLAWAAGFLDGEGCIHISKQRYAGKRTPTYRLGVHIAQNDRSVLEAFCQAVGLLAPIYPVKRASNHRKQCYTLNFNGHVALRLLRLLTGFLKRKQQEAQAAFAFWAEGGIGVPGNGQPVPALPRSDSFPQICLALT